MIAYCAYLVKTLKRHPRIEIYFLIAGHTKFSPDAHFGTFKKKISKSEIHSIKDLMNT